MYNAFNIELYSCLVVVYEYYVNRYMPVESLYTVNIFEQSFSYFYSNFLYTFNANILLKTIQLKYNNRISFLTDGLKKTIKQQHMLLDICNKNPTDENKANYTHHRNILTSILRLNERSHHENQIEINKDDSTKC